MNTPSDLTNSDANRQRRDRWWALVAGLMIMVLTLIPYLVGFSQSNGRQFMWLGYNLDDSCVYLSWMRQARDGALLGFNLFTTEPQHGMVINPLFLLLGVIARLTGLPLLAVYHVARLLAGLALLLVVWRLIEILTPDRLARKLAYLFVGLSAGLGWLPFWWQDPAINTPIDKWQPEAITFLSLYLSPLFCCSLALQVGIILLLFQSDRTGQLRPAIMAGICAFVLGLIHTYDVLSLAAVWLTYLIAGTIRPASDASCPKWTSWRNSLVAGGIALPAVLYIYNQLRTETVFQQRAAVPTPSPTVGWILCGYGLTLALALFAIFQLTRSRSTQYSAGGADPGHSLSLPPDAARLLVTWMAANLLVSYIPTTFQRKLLQGEHFPIAILAGVGAAWIFTHWRLQSWKLWVAVAGLTLFLCLSNIRFLLRDIDNYSINLAQTRQQRTYLKAGEIEALNWIETHVPCKVAVQPLPYLDRSSPDPSGHWKYWPTDMSMACFTPGLTGHYVYCGHWGETPDYREKLTRELEIFMLPKTSDSERVALLAKWRVGFILYSQKDADDNSAIAPVFRGKVLPPAFLKLVYSNPDADIYEVELSLYKPEPP